MKRSAREILEQANPINSTKRYDYHWKQFCNFCKLSEGKPNEEDFLQYFDFLKNERQYASSTLWSIYSMLNYKLQLLFGEKIQQYPRITLLLKSFEAGYVRKTANTFSKEQILEFLKEAPNDDEFVYMKAAVVIAWCGGLRCADLVEIVVSDCEFDETTGMWITYKVSKQKGERKSNTFNVPLELCEFLERHDNALHRSNASNGRIFKTFRKNKNGTWYYKNQPMGKHTLAKVCTKMAEFLKLENPKSYTGHSMRRSSANLIAEAGASSEVMKKHFNWKNEATCSKYVDSTKSAKLQISKMFVSDETLTTHLSEKGEKQNILKFENCQNVVVNFN